MKPGPQLQIAEGVCLFVLDDAGVFFCGPTQELSVFNSAATLIWCGIEEGLSPTEIADTYGRTFVLESQTAASHVSEALALWQGLGYIDGYAIPQESKQPLLQAVARLLVNDSLRAEFKRAPNETAQKLGVGGTELEDLVALDAEALEREASSLRARQALARRESGSAQDQVFSAVLDNGTSVLEAVATAMLRHLAAPVDHRNYRMLDTTFCIRFGSVAQAERVQPVVAHLAFEEVCHADCILDLIDVDGGYVLVVDGIPAAHCRHLGELAPLVKNQIRQIATSRHRSALEIHAGVVSNGSRCILLPGAPGQGKTTLTAALTFAGFRYFSDEVAPLEEPDFTVRPLPLGLGIKPGAVDVLAPLYPEVRELAVHDREDEQRVRYLNPPIYRESWNAAQPVGWIIFPAYDATAETRLEPISRTEALRRLMGECMALPDLLDEARVYALVRWLRTVECLELPLSSLPMAVDLVERHCGRGQSPAP